MELKKIEFPLPTYWHKFQRINGTYFEVETTLEDVIQLGTKDHIDPTSSDGKYIGSGGRIKIPTGCYTIDSNNNIVLNSDGETKCASVAQFEETGTLKDVILKK